MKLHTFNHDLIFVRNRDKHTSIFALNYLLLIAVGKSLFDNELFYTVGMVGKNDERSHGVIGPIRLPTF